MEYSLGILKPDCLERNLLDYVFDMIKKTGLEIVVWKRLQLSKEDILRIYCNCVHESFFDELTQFLTSGDVVVYIVRGKNAIERLNKLTGSTNPKKAGEGTIRRLGESIRRNLAHSSSDKDAFLRESSVIFPKDEFKKN